MLGIAAATHTLTRSSFKTITASGPSFGRRFTFAWAVETLRTLVVEPSETDFR